MKINEIQRYSLMNAKLYTVKEVAAILKVVEETVRKKLRSGEIKGIKPGQSWLIYEDSIKKYMGGNDK